MGSATLQSPAPWCFRLAGQGGNAPAVADLFSPAALLAGQITSTFDCPLIFNYI
jgi:hypothetical protein